MSAPHSLPLKTTNCLQHWLANKFTNDGVGTLYRHRHRCIIFFYTTQCSNCKDLICINPSTGTLDIIDLWSSQISGKNENDAIYDYVALPSLIFNEKDFELIHAHTTRPNFITDSLIKGELINLDSLSDDNYDHVSGRIVLLEKADPGYDWIFSKGIAGLITRFGGAASHMAIRCAEFGIPAAIGCGETIFKELKAKHVVELNCAEKTITSVWK